MEKRFPCSSKGRQCFRIRMDTVQALTPTELSQTLNDMKIGKATELDEKPKDAIRETKKVTNGRCYYYY